MGLDLLQNYQYGVNYQPNNNFGSLTGASKQVQGAPTTLPQVQQTPYEKDMADFRNSLPQNNGTGDLNPFGVNETQGQNLYVKEGVDTTNSVNTKVDTQSRGQDILNNNFGGDVIAAMEYLEKMQQAA